MQTGIIGSLVIVMILYVSVGVVITGMMPWNEIPTKAPIISVFNSNGLDWASSLVTAGSMIG